MVALLQLYLDNFIVFTLVLTRVSGLVVTAPIYGTADIPIQVRGLLAFSLALLITPLQWHLQIESPGNIFNYLVFLGAELLIGLTLGLGITILFSGLQVAGGLIGRSSGMALASVFNPLMNQSVPIYAQLLNYVTLAVFVTMGGHRMLMAAMLDTFSAIPPGMAAIPTGLGDAATALLSESFRLGLRASAPVVTALMLSTLIMGLISRTMPQLNILAVGFGMNSLMTMATLAFCFSAICYLFQAHVEPVLEMLTDMLSGASTSIAPSLGL